MGLCMENNDEVRAHNNNEQDDAFEGDYRNYDDGDGHDDDSLADDQHDDDAHDMMMDMMMTLSTETSTTTSTTTR